MSWEKIMFSIYFTRRGVISIDTLTRTERFNYIFFTITVFQSVAENIKAFCPKMQAQGSWLHIDNAKLHNTALSLQKTEETRFIKLPHRHIPLIWHRATSSYSGT
jgi:hypothetical protein